MHSHFAQFYAGSQKPIVAQPPKPATEYKAPASKTPLFPETKDEELKKIWRAYTQAKETYESEKRTPFSKSKLGGQFGLFSYFRHGKCPLEFEQSLAKSNDAKEAELACIRYLRIKGSLWDTNESNVHSFSNYFLTKLRAESLTAYKSVVGSAYGIHFISDDAIELFRNDTRDSQTIFSEGFDLSSWANSYGSRRYACAEIPTYQSGISTSKTSAGLAIYGQNQYRIKLPQGHSLLAIDLSKSSRNAKSRLKSLEVNFIDPIPSRYIFSCKTEERYRSSEAINPNFSGDPDISKTVLKPRGCC